MHKDFIALGDPPKPTPTQKPRPTSTPKPTSSPDRFSEKEVYLAAQLAHLENRGGSLKGYKAVISVVLNRLSHIHFPDTIRGVIYQNNQFTVVDSIPGTTPCNNALKAAREVLNGSGSTLPSDVVFSGWLHLAQIGETTKNTIALLTTTPISGGLVSCCK